MYYLVKIGANILKKACLPGDEGLDPRKIPG
jgi:hypothetical protein